MFCYTCVFLFTINFKSFQLLSLENLVWKHFETGNDKYSNFLNIVILTGIVLKFEVYTLINFEDKNCSVKKKTDGKLSETGLCFIIILLFILT